MYVADNVTLITKMECEESSVSSDEAKSFIAQGEPVRPPPSAPVADNADDMMDELE